MCRLLKECNEPKYSERIFLLFYSLPISDVNNLQDSIRSWEFYENIFSSLIHVYLHQTTQELINLIKLTFHLIKMQYLRVKTVTHCNNAKYFY